MINSIFQTIALAVHLFDCASKWLIDGAKIVHEDAMTLMTSVISVTLSELSELSEIDEAGVLGW